MSGFAQAQQEFTQDHMSRKGYLRSQECELADNLILAFNTQDVDALQKCQRSSQMVHLDGAVARLGRGLKIDVCEAAPAPTSAPAKQPGHHAFHPPLQPQQQQHQQEQKQGVASHGAAAADAGVAAINEYEKKREDEAPVTDAAAELDQLDIPTGEDEDDDSDGDNGNRLLGGKSVDVSEDSSLPVPPPANAEQGLVAPVAPAAIEDEDDDEIDLS